MKLPKLLSAAFLLIFVAACQTAEVPDERIGRLYQKEMLVGIHDIPLPLPPGDWELVATDKKYNAPRSDVDGVMLVRIEEGKLTGVIKAGASSVLATNGYAPAKFCNFPLAFVKTIRSNISGGFQDCWAIIPWVMKRSITTSKMGEVLYRYLEENETEYARNFLTAGFRKATKNKMLVAFYAFNPELEGIDPALVIHGPDSEWAPLNYKKDPKKIKMIDELSEWAKEWDQTVTEAFGAGLPES